MYMNSIIIYIIMCIFQMFLSYLRKRSNQDCFSTFEHLLFL